MSKNFDYSVNLPESLIGDMKKSEYLGEGHNGVVFLLPNSRAIKFFREETVWHDETYILEKTQSSRFFPRIYEHDKNYVVREFIDGIRLDKYLKNHNLDDKICEELYQMIIDFERLRFTRVDLRCKDLFVQEDKTIKIIDPKHNYKKVVTYPRHLMKGLYKKNVLRNFLNYIEKRDFKRYIYWEYKMEKYIKRTFGTSIDFKY